MLLLQWIVISCCVASAACLVAGLGAWILKGRVEVNPKEAVVCKNMWTGSAFALRRGTHWIILGLHRILKTVSLRSEPWDPDIFMVTTADPTEVGVDLVIFNQYVRGDRETGPQVPMLDPDGIDPIVKAATRINYDKRNELILERAKAEAQTVLGEYRFDTLYNQEINPETKKPKGLNRELIKRISDQLNDLLEESVSLPWGIEVKARIENLVFKIAIQEAVSDLIVADNEGEAIHRKAEKSKANPNIIAAGEIIANIAEIFKGKGGSK